MLKYIFLLALFVSIQSLDNGLARTPPMAWLTWERFRCNVDCTNDPSNCISERLIKEMADKMVEDGYLDAGYEYIIVDDCWPAMQRDENSRLQPNKTRFPSGIKALADYVHSKGLKFGIYEDFGTLTCGGYPGSLNYLELDAQTFADWTVDYVKLDGCYADIKLMPEGYPRMGQFLNKTGRPMVYSCSWPAYEVGEGVQPNYTRIAEFCNLWRNYDDIQDSFQSLQSITEWYASQQETLALSHGPGNWNDPDMLIIGNYGLSYGQAKAQMALWAIFAAPLVMSVDLRTIEPWFAEILKNKNMIGINQDKLGIMGKRFLQRSGVELWRKPLDSNNTAFVFFNPLPYGTPTSIRVTLKELGLTNEKSYLFYESFSGKLIGKYDEGGDFSVTVDPSGSVFAFVAQPYNGISSIKNKLELGKKKEKFLQSE